METITQTDRRPLRTRSRRWAQSLAAQLAKVGFSPNGVSMLGLVFAGFGTLAMLKAWWWTAAVAVQLRLLCNMLDGLIAVEQGKGDKLGGFFNEVPDRLEDVALLLASGYAASRGSAGAVWLTFGWTAALLALGTAYLRQVGGAMGLVQDFCGPLAKPQRMFVLTVTLLMTGFAQTLIDVLDPSLETPQLVLRFGLGVIVAGTAITVARRAWRLVGALKRR